MRPPWTLAALTSWPRAFTDPRRDHPFRSNGRYGVDWDATIRLLRKELRHLEAENVVLRIAVPAESIRLDGHRKSGRADPSHPGVILTFESMYGPLSYPADRFQRWRANVRAIAVSLENLRRVDRYGVTQTGEQYSGFKQIGSGAPNSVDPHAVLARWSGWNEAGVRSDPQRAYRLARRTAHPDSAQGAEDSFKEVVAAGTALGVG